MDLGEIVIADEVRALAGRMPGRTRGEFAFLDQNNVSATLLSQVVEQSDSHNSAPNYDDAGMTVRAVLHCVPGNQW